MRIRTGVFIGVLFVNSEKKEKFQKKQKLSHPKKPNISSQKQKYKSAQLIRTVSHIFRFVDEPPKAHDSEQFENVAVVEPKAGN